MLRPPCPSIESLGRAKSNVQRNIRGRVYRCVMSHSDLGVIRAFVAAADARHHLRRLRNTAYALGPAVEFTKFCRRCQLIDIAALESWHDPRMTRCSWTSRRLASQSITADRSRPGRRRPRGTSWKERSESGYTGRSKNPRDRLIFAREGSVGDQRGGAGNGVSERCCGQQQRSKRSDPSTSPLLRKRAPY